MRNAIEGVAGLKVLAACRATGAPATVVFVGASPGFTLAAYTGVGNYLLTMQGPLVNLTAVVIATSETAGLIASVVRAGAGAWGPPVVGATLQVLLMSDAAAATDGTFDIMVLAL
jgi:hypothetical protein